MRSEKVLEMTLMSMFVAIIAILTLVPNIGYIPFFFGVALTIIHIPVLVGAALFKPRFAWSLGLIFGLSSLLVAFWRPVGPMDVAFQNPLISVLPRFLFGVAAVFIFKGLSQVIKNDRIALPLAFFLSTVVHTILVLTALALVMPEMYGGGNIFLTILNIVAVNGALEAVLAALVGTPLVIALKNYLSLDN